MKLSCMIIDDEEIAVRGIEKYALQVPFIGPLHLCGSSHRGVAGNDK